MDEHNPPDRDQLLVWEVEADHQGVGGVTLDARRAKADMLDALEEFQHARGRVRRARLVLGSDGCTAYAYGETLLTAHRHGRVLRTVQADAWEQPL